MLTGAANLAWPTGTSEDLVELLRYAALSVLALIMP
jgi:hypothetical protein